MLEIPYNHVVGKLICYYIAEQLHIISSASFILFPVVILLIIRFLYTGVVVYRKLK